MDFVRAYPRRRGSTNPKKRKPSFFMEVAELRSKGYSPIGWGWDSPNGYHIVAAHQEGLTEMEIMGNRFDCVSYIKDSEPMCSRKYTMAERCISNAAAAILF